MPITNATAVSFANTRVRPFADAYLTTYATAKALVAEWNATGMSALVPNDSNLFVDGSATDGRHPITGANATSVITRALELIADFEAGGSAKLNTIANPAVNGGSKY